jgi:hypothetical protein
MLPLFKVFSLIVRVFSRPVVNYIKSIHKSNFKNLTGISKFLVVLGNKQHRLEVFINRKLMNLKTDSDMFTKPLSAEIALEKGIEFFYEIFFYSIILGIAGYELYKAQIQADEKKAKDETRIKHIEGRIGSGEELLKKSEFVQATTLPELQQRMDIVNKNLEKCLELMSELAHNENHKTATTAQLLEYKRQMHEAAVAAAALRTAFESKEKERIAQAGAKETLVVDAKVLAEAKKEVERLAVAQVQLPMVLDIPSQPNPSQNIAQLAIDYVDHSSTDVSAEAVGSPSPSTDESS